MEKTGTRTRNALQKAIVFFLGLMVILCLLELELRIIGAVYYRKAHSDTRVSSPGRYTILCLGDSYTYGMGAPPEGSYPSQLERLLNSGGSGGRFLVVNRGQPAQNTSQLLQELKGNLDTVRPDMVIIMTGLNDAWNLIGYGEYLQRRTPQALPNDVLYRIRIFRLSVLLIRNLRDKLASNLGLREEKMKNGQVARRPTPPAGFPPRASAVISKDYSLEKGRRKVGDINYGRAESCFSKGDALLRKHQYTEAAAYFAEGIGINPDFGDNYYGLGCCSLEKGNKEEASRWFEKGLERNPHDSSLYSMIVETWLSRRDQEKAREVLEKGIKALPEFPLFYERLGGVYMDTQNIREAEKCFLKLLEIDPSGSAAVRRLAWIYQMKKDYARALYYYREAMKRDPGEIPRLAPSMMLIYDEEKNYEEMKRTFRELAKVDPRIAPGLELLTQGRESALVKVEKWIRDDLSAVIMACRDRQIQVILQTYPGGLNISNFTSSGVIEETAGLNSVPLVNNQALFDRLPDKKSLFVRDGHCNEKGYAVVAGNVYDTIKALIPRF